MVLYQSTVTYHVIFPGGTGVEDKLQDAVPEVLGSFRKAGTGSIVYCKLYCVHCTFGLYSIVLYSDVRAYK